MAWTITFTTVTWTAGDLITEAKLDAMVANDQAYDAFASSGLLLNNAIAFSSKDTGGTKRDLIGIDASDNIQVGKDAEAGHTVINAGTNKLVKFKVLRQDDTSNAYQANSVILCGWGFKAFAAGQTNFVETVTFGITFAAVPIVVSCAGGSKNNSDPSNPGDSDSNAHDFMANANQETVTTTKITVASVSGYIPGTTYRGIYKWIAIGVLS